MDEFGRDQLYVIGVASMLSIGRALVMTGSLLVVSAILVFLVEVRRLKYSEVVVSTVVDGLESVPIYVWVLAGISWAPSASLVLVVVLFSIAGLPLLYNGLSGIVRQVIGQSYCLSAIAMGASHWHLFFRHIMPNAMPLLAPLLFYAFGAAIAVFGGIGVFGFVSRRELDLGIVLLRGKERAGFDLTLMGLGVGAYLVIYLGIQILAKHSERSIDRGHK